MVYRQVSFKIASPDLYDADDKDLVYGGIAAYEELADDYILQFVICGCCGSVFEPEDIKIIRIFSWINISDAIIGE